MLVGDAGYGLLFLALTLTLRFAARKAPRDMIRLLLLLSVCTIAWGSLTGSWFGSSRLPALLDTARLPWLADDRNLMGLCFLIGSIHLTVAHLWSAVRTINRPVAIAQLGWIGMTWTMFLMARSLILDYPVPSFTLWMFLGSLAAIVLFMTPPGAIKHSWPDHVMLPLTVIGNFGDVVSYVRLFAVGSAGAAISQAFNEMALGNGIPTVWAGLSAALILFAAHTLNILLCALGVIVHGVRLNTLEFCSHMGIQWSGFKYRPFSRESAGETA
jgi:V/A-type H+-transporting ATPase subunit I